MKKRKYQTGGDVEEQKRKGLETSAGEKVGFFERLRMGNIDDPTSEAYKRFGAGRGASEDRLAEFRKAEADAGRAADFRKIERGSLAAADARRATPTEVAASSTSEAPPEPAAESKPATKAKAPIVTKEQMQKAGFDNLRDYLNAQKGLKRRSDTAPRSNVDNEAAAYAQRFRADREKYMKERGMKSGGMVKSSASKRADGIAQRGKTRGKIC